ncbi:MAG: hypothetical protein Q8M31_06825 [Beijerinckiaceae bacterium]|nr:hypothetical protein [Beijerinckiaceae bacterium]
MISIIVYGRNDDRGYGMVKRVAVSINAMAHVLSAPTSEILFVDYNTPDHLPTLPEAIADTLTPAARARLRVFRVRPSVHARFADFTPLPVLEPVARNVALRRSCMRNRWILATNTDSIIALREGGSLDEIVSALEKGSYGVPRFELPERAWEGFDRMDPAGSIAGAREWGRIGRLDEAVSGEGDVLFDGPGDFQLAPRSDLFAIDGFDEDMLLGWHVDHNLAVRLGKRLGPCRDLSDQLALYHCGHVRQATQTHGHDRVQNDTSRFVDRVAQAECPGQRDAWGCPDDLIEEICLDRSRPQEILAIAGAIMAPLQGDPLRARFGPSSYGSYWYDAGHVATHVLDLASAFPTEFRVGYAGVRRDTFALLRRGLEQLGLQARLLVPLPVAARLGADDAIGVEVLSAEEFAEVCDLPLFEFGLIRDEGDAGARSTERGVEPTSEEIAALETVRHVFQLTAAAEMNRGFVAAQKRLFVTINAVHNSYESSVASQLAAVPAPFSTRLRYGPLKSALEREAMPQGLRLAQASGLSEPPTSLEIMRARALLRTLISPAPEAGDHDLEVAAMSEIIAALLADVAAATLPADSRARILSRLEAARRPRVTIPLKVGPPPGPPALASLAAWRDPAWRAQASRMAVSNGQRRDGWIWERAQILWALERRGSAPARRALVVSEHPDPLVSALDGLFERVDVIDVRLLTTGCAPALTRLTDFSVGPIAGRSQFCVLDSVHRDVAYDAVILPHATGFRHGVAGLADVVGLLRPVLADGGLLVIAGEVAVEGRLRPLRPDLAMAGSDGIPRLLGRHAALAPVAPFPEGVFESDAALVGTPADLAGGRPVLGTLRDEDVFWPAVWLFEARQGALDTASLNEGMRLALLGEQIVSMRLGAGARREGGVIVSGPGEPGHVAFGPYLPLSAGAYRAVVEVDVASTGESLSAELVAEVAFGSQTAARQAVSITRTDAFKQAIEMPFRLDRQIPFAAGDGYEQLCEIRLWSNGVAALTVRSVLLERTSGHGS